MDQPLRLRYSGRAADSGQMDAYEVADAIKGFSDFTLLIGRTLYGEEVQIDTTVRGISAGSFDIDFLYRLSEAAGLTLAIIGPTSDFLTLLRNCFALLKFLQGEPPKSLRHHERGVSVENNHGTINNFDHLTVNIVTNPAAGRAVRNFIRKPLEQAADNVEIMVDDHVLVAANEDEATAFVPVNATDTLTEHTAEMHLTILTAVLQGKSRWKFSDGRTSFYAPIEDEEFLARVDSGRESFRRGDELRVRLRATQKRINGKLQSERAIEKVLEHVKPGRQRNLL